MYKMKYRYRLYSALLSPLTSPMISSGSALVADRWCQYLLKCTTIDDGFILTYRYAPELFSILLTLVRSVMHKDCPPEKGAERMDLLVGATIDM